jgi:hypothetical protein
MVNEEKTLADFGYVFFKLKSQSRKKIYVNCDYCGNEKIITRQFLTESTKTVNKYACKKYSPIKLKEVNLIKYGVTCNFLQILATNRVMPKFGIVVKLNM